MSLPAYNLYRESGIDWVDRVPQHWQIASLKWLSTRYSGGTPDRNRLDYWEDGTIPWLNSGAVNSPIIDEPSAYITEEAFANSSAKWVPQNALVMALAGQGKTKGMVAQVSFPTTCNQSMAALIPDERLAARYLYWWLASNYQNIRNMAGGDLRDGLNLELLGSISCPLPSPEEQGTIAAFLDRETGKIDALIAEQEKLLELLAEKRQATISNTVTRGLNPDVPLKDSGVEWLGAVPAHWEVVGLTKYLDSIVDYRGRTPTKVDNGAFLVTAKNIRSGAIDYEASQEYIDVAEYDEVMRRGRPLKGDVLFTTEAPLGQVAIVDREDIALAQRIIKFRPAPRHLDSGYLKVWIMGSACQFNLELLATGSTALGIKGSKVGQVRLCLPPLEEQQEIVRHINIELSKLSALDAESKRAIELLKERRSALISAAVTGKIDVREHSSALAVAA